MYFLNHGCPGQAIGWELKFNLESPVSAALVAVVWVIDWLVSFTFTRLGFLLAEEMKAELGQEIPCTQVFLVSPCTSPRGTTGGQGCLCELGVSLAQQLPRLCIKKMLGRALRPPQGRGTNKWPPAWPQEPSEHLPLT